MREIQLPSGKYLLVEVPERTTAKQFFIHYDRVWVDSTYPKDYFSKRMPTGQWAIVGKASELTEQQWKGIVDRGFYEGNFCGYPSYELKQFFYSYAAESGQSLIKSHSMKSETTLILKAE